MDQGTSPAQGRSPFAALRQFAQPAARRAPVERCDMCSIELPEAHQHLVEPTERRILCACDACALLFCEDGTTKHRRVPRDTWLLRNFTLGAGRWDELNIPIGLVFFFRSSASEQVVAVYPSPAGPTESSIDDDVWDRVVRANPALQRMQPDVEALLINRLGQSHEHYLAPIDKCYALVGLIRANWEGFTGGAQAREAMQAFFTALRRRARVRTAAGKEAQP